jgi:hypothetical protein
MAWYDLADDGDGNAEMMVRQEYFPPSDPRILSGLFAQPTNQIRYSWDMDNNRTWDYKLDLVGRYQMDTVVNFDSLAIETLPYDDFPDWVTQRSWDAAFFVAAENGGEWSSEGIYDWAGNQGFVDGERVYSPLRDVYMTGILEEQPREYYRDISEGYRGEYSFEFSNQPYLYFSPIDRSLHLLGVDWGMWNVDGVRQVVYEDMNRDGYLDGWHDFVEERLERSLVFAPPFLIYADLQGVRMIRTESPLSLFETLPPGNHDEWLSLARDLRSHERDFAPGDLLVMFQQFEGAAVQISGVTLRDFRFTEPGFRFVLEPSAGAQPAFSGELALPGLEDVAWPALIAYEGQLTAVPLTLPSLYFDTDSLSTVPKTLRELETSLLRIPLDNQGLEDTGALTVTAHLRRGQEQVVLTTTLSTVPGQGQATAQFDWAPPSPGLWDVSFALVGSDYESGGPSPAAQVAVASAGRASWWDLVMLDSAPGFMWAIGILLASAALAAAVVGLLIGRALLRQVEG